MKKIYYLLFIVLYGCSSINNRIINYIDCNCDFINNDTCFIDMEKVFQKDFETLYIFGETTTASEISEAIGMPYQNNTYISDSKYRIIMVYNSDIIYEEDFYQKDIKFSTNKKHKNIIYTCKQNSTTFTVYRIYLDSKKTYFYYLE